MAKMHELAGAGAIDDPMARTAVPFPATAAAAAAARPSFAPGFGIVANPVQIAEAIRLLRVGSLVGLAFALTTPPPRPTVIEITPDFVLVANYRRGSHAFFLRGADGMFRLSPVIGSGTPDGRLVADLGALERAYGRALPPAILAMARPRPANVAAALQTTSSGIARAMAGAPDPCNQLPGQRHHMIPASLMPTHQTFLTAIGFTLDQGANLINLPSNTTQQNGMAQHCRQNRPIHNGRTASIYERAVSSQLNTIEGELNAGLITRQGAADKVQRLMTLIRRELESGRYANVNDPALSRTIAGWRI